MKRLNPDTGKPFRCGDVREDGKIFHGYVPNNKISADGYYYEHWEDEKIYYYNKTKRKITSKNHALTHKGRALHMVRNCKRSAKKRNIVFNLNVEDLLPAIELKHCQLTGLPFDLNPPKEKTMNLYAPSVDRIDNNKGYTKDNIRVVLWAVNRAVGEDGDEAMLPILKAMINAMEKNVKENSTTPIPEGSYIQGAVGNELGSISTPWTWEDYDHADDYRGATQGENSYRSAKEGSGNRLGARDQKVGAPITPTRIEDNGESEPEIIRLDFGRRYLSD